MILFYLVVFLKFYLFVFLQKFHFLFLIKLLRNNYIFHFIKNYFGTVESITQRLHILILTIFVMKIFTLRHHNIKLIFASTKIILTIFLKSFYNLLLIFLVFPKIQFLPAFLAFKPISLVVLITIYQSQ